MFGLFRDLERDLPRTRGHPAIFSRDVTLLLTTPAGEPGEEIVTLFGGQSTLNLP